MMKLLNWLAWVLVIVGGLNWGLVGFLCVVYAANLFGAPPPSVEAIAWLGHLQWLIVLWGFWIDKHRVIFRHKQTI